MGERRSSVPKVSNPERVADPRLNPGNYMRQLSHEKPLYSHQKQNESRVSEKSHNEMHVSSHSDYSESTPPRYSPPPSLKPYTIPRRAGQKSKYCFNIII